MIVSYKIVTGSSPEDIVKAVNALVKNGWQPFGDLVQWNLDAFNPRFCQPMVREVA